MNQRFSSYIAGQWVEGDGGHADENPSDLDVPVGQYGVLDAARTAQAVDAASAALPKWALSNPQQRADILDAVGSEILARKEELGRLLAREEGKTLAESIGEAARAGQIFKFFAGEALRIPGEKLASTRPGVDVEITREPVGAVGIIAPWNFPLAIPAWKIAPALAYGNTVVFKPAEIVPGCAWAIAEILARAGLPEGAFNMVLGSGRVVGQAMIEHKGLDALTFTGSVPTGHALLKQAAARALKVQMEMGGKNPLVVLADADLDKAVECAVNGAFFSTGQRCTASSRLIVENAVYDVFVARMQARMAKIRVGDPLEQGVDIGPAASQAQLDTNLSYIQAGHEDGAELLAGGERVEWKTRGHFLAPTLFAAKPSDRIAREEIFGPVAALLRADDYEHALALANDTEFGLCAGICTTSLKHATHFKRHAQAGMVMVNLPTAGVDPHVPFGGRKASSYGPREQGRYAVEFYTTVKTAYTSA
ncbi:aldehyde dehydrogenase family protein [Pseudoxanthomonas broegbernensis]|uniref:Aldehyde dehydrogenase family protein n=1 Tax=Pseudoxanthomonas broegbernensis TaxID=83619 RepID=A0A7V8K6P5_9GAMM|nr:aldehyde dehydrogenase family protein [Pseudoxanthomonas broegbernensis]KAF1686170.1 aldehyde dehydrogenase family protein [Pseudoxanthomonas broegbernensis]MBB6063876.1 aldehyde dehydrogenase (NAD+) [Pseudoxanthomonas broegbernensis]